MDKGEMLSIGLVENVAVDTLVKEAHFPDDAFVLVESLPQKVIVDQKKRQGLLRFTRLQDEVDLSQYASGRIFHSNFELRWEQDTQGTHAVYIGEERTLSGMRFIRHLRRSEPAQKYYVFGEHLSEKQLEAMGIERENGYTDYAEVRIPRLLHYPISTGATRLQLLVWEYIDETTGRVQWFRFANLKPAEDEKV